MSAVKLFIIFIYSLIIIGLDLLWGSNHPIFHVLFNPTLMLVIALTVGERLIIGLGVAIIAGLAFTLFSAVNGPIFPLAFLAAATASWIFSAKIVTTRSAVSFISTIMIGTAGYTIFLIIADSLLSLFNRQRIHLDLNSLLISGAVQLITHPIILSIIWRWFGRHQYHRLTASPGQSF